MDVHVRARSACYACYQGMPDAGVRWVVRALSVLTSLCACEHGMPVAYVSMECLMLVCTGLQQPWVFNIGVCACEHRMSVVYVSVECLMLVCA
eukprot:1161306-Pelagomonas_calceolata.AAC.4